MSSPFDVFRRHQKVAMVVLVFMAMFAFIVLDAFQRMQEMPTAVVAVAIGLLFAGVFWVIGNQRGEGKQYALLGGIIGTCAGFIGPQLNRPPALVTTSVGRMTEKDVSEALHNRNIANNFLQQASFEIESAYRKANPDAQQAPSVPQQYLFGMFNRAPAEDVALASVFLHEADRMGIKVTNETVTDYIKQATGMKLRKADFQGVLKRIGIDEGRLYDAMRDEIKAKLAYQQLEPRLLMVPTPDDYWQLYQRVHVRQQLEVAAIGVGAFAKEIDAPSDAELQKFFSEYAGVQPTSAVSAEPAFGTPRQARLAWFQAENAPAEKAAAAEIDREIAEATGKGLPSPVEVYYEKNKERYRNRRIPDRTPKPPKPSDGPVLPELTPENEKTPDATKPDDKKDGKKPGETKPEEGKKPDDAKKPESDKDSKDPKSEGSSDEDEQENAEAESKSDDSKADPKTDKDAPRETADDEKAPAGDDAPAVAEIPGETLEEDIPEFKPLDETLRDEIRQELISARAREDLRKRMNAAKAKVEELYNAYNEESFTLKKGEKRSFTLQKLSNQLDAWAKEHDLEYVVSKFVSYEELTKPDDYPIGLAGDANAMSFQRRTVAEQVFSQQNIPKYLPSVSVDVLGDYFTWWVIDDEPARVSNFDQEGMKEKVLEAWRMRQARKPAEERAEALVKKARDAGDKPLEEILGEETVTGKPDSVQLTVHDTPTFSWLTSSQVPSMRGFDMPRLTSIPFVANAGEEFMRTVFEDLKPGEVGAVPNEDKTAWYIVKVKERSPSTGAGEEQLRKDFLQARVDSDPTYQILLYQERRSVQDKWMNGLFKKYQIDLTGLQQEGPRGRR